MSKIGRKPIALGAVKITINNNVIEYKGPKAAGVHELPAGFAATVEDNQLFLTPTETTRDTNRLWGLHRALLNNAIYGADQGFERKLKIVGLGFKAVPQKTGLQFSLGYSHKIDYALPAEVTVEVDKTGQLLTFRSFNKEKLGLVCSQIRDLRKPEPYKGTGIQYEGEVILRKVGKK